MKRRGVTLWILLVLLVAGAGEAVAASIATVQSASNASLRRRNVATFATLNGRTPLNAGDMVRTGPRGKASLLFIDGSQLRLNRNTTVQITSPTRARGGRQSFFRALSGEVYARMRPGSAAQTRTAVAGVRGTEILLQVAEDGTTVLTVIDGAVDFYNEFGEVVVNQSQQSTAAPGRAPTTPITIDNPGLLIEWTFDIDFAVLPREKFWVSRSVNALQAQQGGDLTPRESGDLLFDLRRYEDALAAYQQAAAAAPDDGEIQLRTGYALLELGRLDEAEEYFRAVLNEPLVAQRKGPRFQLIAATTDEPVNAASTLRVQALTGLAWVELARNDAAAAEVHAARAVKAAPRSVEARVVLGVSQLRQAEKLEQSIATLRAADNGEPAAMRYQAQAWLALALLARGNNAEALETARNSVTSAPDSGLARGHLALALLFNDQSREATKEARRATELNPDAVAARVALAQSLLVSGDTDAAAREAAIAAALDPQLPQGLYILGLADAARRDYSHAARSLEESLETAPEFLPAASALARVYTLMGREQEAVALLADFQERHPQSSEVLAALGQVYYQQGNYGEAAAQYQRAVNLQPNSALYQAELARLLLDDNQLNAALTAAQRAVFIAPQVGQYHALLGLIADFSGLAAYADREYRTAMALDPQNALARARIGLNNADARTGFNTTTQAFLYDPAISRQLFRGGIQGEVTGSVGSNDYWSLSGAHRWQSDDGKLYNYALGSYSRSDGAGDGSDDSRNYTVQDLVTWVPNNRTNVLLRGSATRNEFGIDGPPGTEDNRSETNVPRAGVAARHRIGKNHYLWAGARYDSIRTLDSDPNADSNFYFADTVELFPGFFVPVGYYLDRQELRARVLEPEVRLDLNLSEVPGRSILTFGAAYARQRAVFTEDIQAVFPTLDFSFPLGNQITDATRRKRLFYTQWAHRLNEKTSFIAQLRRQDISGTSSFEYLGSPFSSTTTDESRILPSLLINHQLDNKTALRFFANRNVFDVGLQVFAPTETYLSSEGQALANGLSDNTRLYELDIERYFSPRTFGKAFLFHSRSQSLGIGNLLIPETRRTGVGFRLEHQLNENFFANAMIGFNRTTASAPGWVWNNETAPYQPRHFGRFALNYVDPRGNKASLVLNRSGSFYQDTAANNANRPRFPAKTTFDLRLAHEPSLKHEVFLNVYNILDSEQISFNGYHTGGRRFEIGYSRRF